MECIRNKLKSENGVTILFALLAFMLAIVVATILVSAALTSVKRVVNDQKEQQTHYTLSCAAQLVKEELEETTVTSVTKIKQDVNGNAVGQATVTVSGTGTFAEELKKAIQYVNQQNSQFVGAGQGCDFKIQVEGADLKDVSGTMILERIGEVNDSSTRYHAVFKFTLEDSAETLFLDTDASIQTDNRIVTNKDNTKTITTNQSFSWTSSNIRGMGE